MGWRRSNVLSSDSAQPQDHIPSRNSLILPHSPAVQCIVVLQLAAIIHSTAPFTAPQLVSCVLVWCWCHCQLRSAALACWAPR